MKYNLFILFYCLLFGQATDLFAQILNSEYEAKIEFKDNGEFYEIAAFADNKTDGTFSGRYELSVFRGQLGSANTSKNSQSGFLVLQPKEKSLLSSNNINVTDEDKLIVLLLIYNQDDQLVGKDRVAFNDEQSDDSALKKKVIEELKTSDDVNRGGEDGVEMLRGIVTENTKTKPGRDFFRSFSQEYANQKINGEKIITVEEILAIGSNTKILVKADNEIIFEFFVNPRADYIDQMVGYAIHRTKLYFKRLEKNRNLIKKY